MDEQAIDLVNSWDEEDLIDPGWEVSMKRKTIDKWTVELEIANDDGRAYCCHIGGTNIGKYSTFQIDKLLIDNRWITLNLPIAVDLTLDQAYALTADDIRLLVLEAMSNG